MKLSKPVQIFVFSVPILVGLYFIYKQFSNTGAASDNNDAVNPNPIPPNPDPKKPKNVVVQPSVSDYPLKKGVKNAIVMSLQSLLNTALFCKDQKAVLLVPDGSFGSKTEAALKSLYGKSTIDNEMDFSALKNKLSSACSKTNNLNWGWQLIDKQSGDNTIMVVSSPITMYQVSKPFTLLSNQGWKAVTPLNVVSLPEHSYNLNDYQIKSATNGGQLRIEITNGDYAGMYITSDDTDITNIDIR